MNKNYFRFSLVFFFVFLIGQLISQTKVIPYQQLPGASGIFFGANMTTSSITISFEGPSNKWIGIGFGNSMSGADALIYSNGQNGSGHPLGWNDYYLSSTSSSGINNDGTQNWNIISNNVASGQRTVVASRALNTGDVNDVVFTFSSSVINLIWARGATNDYTLAYHGSNNRGSGIALAWLSQPTASFTTNNQTVCVGAPVTFSNLSTGGQTTYTWALPGTALANSTATNPVVSYTAAGVYSVALTASNVVGTASLAQVAYITVNPTVAPTVSINQVTGTNPICQGSAATFSVNYTNGGPTPQFQWRINNQIVGTNSSSFSSTTIANASSIVCILTTPSTCASPSINTSAAIVLTVNSNAPATVSVTINSGTNPMCVGALTSFTAITGNGGNAPLYQWFLNGTNAGSSNSTFTTNTLSNGDVITCSLVSNASCAITNTAISSAIVVTVSAILVPSVTVISSATNNSICAGNLVTFTASPLNGGSNPTYQWKINGNNAGTNSSSFSVSLPSSTNVISCVLTSNSQCSSPSTATSNVINLQVNPIPLAPLVNPSGTIQLCSGTSTVLSSSVVNGNTWSNGASTNTILVTGPGVFTVTQTQLGCTSLPSAGVHVLSIPSPTAQFTPLAPICKDDDAIVLQGSPAGGVFSGTGVSANGFNPLTSGTGTFVLIYQFTDANTCSDTAAIVANVSDCLGIHDTRAKQLNVIIFPNPSNGTFNIYASDVLLESVLIRDSQSKIVAQALDIVSSQVELKSLNLTNGIYDVEVKTNKGISHMRLSIVK